MFRRRMSKTSTVSQRDFCIIDGARSGPGSEYMTPLKKGVAVEFKKLPKLTKVKDVPAKFGVVMEYKLRQCCYNFQFTKTDSESNPLGGLDAENVEDDQENSARKQFKADDLKELQGLMAYFEGSAPATTGLTPPLSPSSNASVPSSPSSPLESRVVELLRFQAKSEKDPERQASLMKSAALEELSFYFEHCNFAPQLSATTMEQLMRVFEINLIRPVVTANRTLDVPPLRAKVGAKGVEPLDIPDPAWEHRHRVYRLLFRVCLVACYKKAKPGHRNSTTSSPAAAAAAASSSSSSAASASASPITSLSSLALLSSASTTSTPSFSSATQASPAFQQLFQTYIDAQFLGHLATMFHSSDHLERSYLATLFATLYDKCPHVRRPIRQILTALVHQFLDDDISNTYSAATKIWTVLALICKVTLSFGPQFFTLVVLPLFRAPYECLAHFHPPLARAVSKALRQCPRLSCDAIRKLTRWWPISSSSKQKLFLLQLQAIIMERVRKGSASAILQEQWVYSEADMAFMARNELPLFKRVCECVIGVHSELSAIAIRILDHPGVFFPFLLFPSLPRPSFVITPSETRIIVEPSIVNIQPDGTDPRKTLGPKDHPTLAMVYKAFRKTVKQHPYLDVRRTIHTLMGLFEDQWERLCQACILEEEKAEQVLRDREHRKQFGLMLDQQMRIEEVKEQKAREQREREQKEHEQKEQKQQQFAFAEKQAQERSRYLTEGQPGGLPRATSFLAQKGSGAVADARQARDRILSIDIREQNLAHHQTDRPASPVMKPASVDHRSGSLRKSVSDIALTPKSFSLPRAVISTERGRSHRLSVSGIDMADDDELELEIGDGDSLSNEELSE